MIGQKNVMVSEEADGLRIQMVGMPMGKPDESAPQDGGHLFLRNNVRVRPASEISASLYPGISRQDWPSVVTNQGGVPDCIEADVHH